MTGCLDSLAINFYQGANTPSGTCACGGCTDSSRPNYDPTATIDDGLCAPLFPGCTDSRASNYAPEYNQEDESCRIPGCTDSTSGTIDSFATFNVPFLCDSATTVRRKLSDAADCWDPAALNYNEAAEVHVELQP